MPVLEEGENYIYADSAFENSMMCEIFLFYRKMSISRGLDMLAVNILLKQWYSEYNFCSIWKDLFCLLFVYIIQAVLSSSLFFFTNKPHDF